VWWRKKFAEGAPKRTVQKTLYTTTMSQQNLLNVKQALQQKRMPAYRRFIRFVWFCFFGVLIGAAVLFLSISLFSIPSFRELEDPHSALASEVIAMNGEVLGRYYIENRVPVTYDQLSPHLVNALIATEDERFRDHCGIDWTAIARVIVRTLIMRDESAGGGSTITQQLAKMLYSDRDFDDMSPVRKTFALGYRKFREWITAVKLERSYTKEEIVAMYLNQFNFVNNAYGIQSAADIYFGKKPKDLSVEESAMLIGMLQNPSRYNPMRYPESCIKRRRTVLGQMMKHNYITEAQYDKVKLKPLDLSKFKKETPADHKAPYFVMDIRADIKKLLELPECKKPDGTNYDIYKDGLRIFTTIDPKVQQYAEAASRENMVKLQKRFFQVWHGRDPWSYKIPGEEGVGTSDAEIEARKDALYRIIRASDRYATIRPKFMSSVAEKIAEKHGDFELRDVDIERMIESETKKNYLTNLQKRGYISAEMLSKYQAIIKSSDWSTIKRQFSLLDDAVKKAFYTKVPMKVFSYNASGESDTLLSPIDSIKYHRMFLQTGVLAVEPGTGYVRAWVGGIDYKHFQYDHIRTDRQVGSTFKPFVYATAISQQGLTPCYRMYDQAVTIPPLHERFTNENEWTPKNAKGTYSGRQMTLKEGLKHSVNSISAGLMKQMGDTEPVRGLVHNMGIDSTSKRGNKTYRVPKQPSICLGASDLTVWEMAGAYSTFANNGVYTTPTYLMRIEDKNGRTIYRSQTYERTALQPEANYLMVEMLKYVTKGATGFSSIKSEVGGKTGTTNNFSDGWFCGITPSLVVATWVGGEDRWVRFLTLDDGQGARMARPVFVSLINKLEKDPSSGFDSQKRFKKPAMDLSAEWDCSTNNQEVDEMQDAAGSTEEQPFGEEPAAPKKTIDPAKPKEEEFGDEIENNGGN
jgi:penicillin-binding protein 1A